MDSERSIPGKGILCGEDRYEKDNFERAKGIQKNMELHIQVARSSNNPPPLDPNEDDAAAGAADDGDDTQP